MSRFLQALDRKINPVFVKEIRQSLRGRFFRTAFFMALAAAWITTLFVLSNGLRNGEQTSGQWFFLWQHGLYILTSFIVIPQLANRGMSAEREENTFDALMISGLSPARIVMGKVLAASVLQGLFLFAFLPFLSLGFAFFGLDLATSLIILLFTTVGGTGFALFGILAACLAKTRASNNLMQGMFTIGTVGLSMSWIGFSSAVIMDLGLVSLFGGELFAGVAVTLLLWYLFLYWTFAFTAATLTHPEENASARIRFASLLLSLAALLGAITHLSFVPDPEILNIWVVSILLFTMLTHIPSITEEDTLGRRALADLSMKKWRRPGMSLFLKGGNRGVAFFLLSLGIPFLLYLFPVSSSPFSPSVGFEGVIAALVVILALTGTPSLLSSRASTSPRRRMFLRLFILVSLPFISLISILLGMGTKDPFGFPLNAIHLITSAFGEEDYAYTSGAFGLFGIFALVAFIGNLSRMKKARQERKSILRSLTLTKQDGED